MKNHFRLFLATVTLMAMIESVVAQDHGHLNVGAVGTNQNDQLTFDNRDIFDITTNYVNTLTLAVSGTYAGYYQGNNQGNITLTALAATEAHLGPKPNAPALGSRIFAQLVSVDGPADGAFAFWETGATSPTISLVSGTNGTNTFRLSENDGSPGSDPYGHIHGRRFTATKPGIYTVGFRAFDFSTNGIGGGPIHTPSSVIKIYFQAGVTMKSVEPDAGQTRVAFGAQAGFLWQLQAVNAFPAGTNWQAVGDPILGDDYFHEVEDDQAMEVQRYYRVEGAPYVP